MRNQTVIVQILIALLIMSNIAVIGLNFQDIVKQRVRSNYIQDSANYTSTVVNGISLNEGKFGLVHSPSIDSKKFSIFSSRTTITKNHSLFTDEVILQSSEKYLLLDHQKSVSSENDNLTIHHSIKLLDLSSDNQTSRVNQEYSHQIGNFDFSRTFLGTHNYLEGDHMYTLDQISYIVNQTRYVQLFLWIIDLDGNSYDIISIVQGSTSLDIINDGFFQFEFSQDEKSIYLSTSSWSPWGTELKLDEQNKNFTRSIWRMSDKFHSCISRSSCMYSGSISDPIIVSKAIQQNGDEVSIIEYQGNQLETSLSYDLIADINQLNNHLYVITLFEDKELGNLMPYHLLVSTDNNDLSYSNISSNPSNYENIDAMYFFMKGSGGYYSVINKVGSPDFTIMEIDLGRLSFINSFYENWIIYLGVLDFFSLLILLIIVIIIRRNPTNDISNDLYPEQNEQKE